MPQVAAGQRITVDGRFSPAQTLVGPNYPISAGLGKQVGGNLFHSFGQFGLAIGESATFSGPATVSNVVGRVTGGNPSSVDGRIQSNIAGANLYLINPSGIVFGPNATVNVSGSFHASTADYVKMSDGARFQATNPDASKLSAAPPVAFGFLTPQPAAISVNGSSLGPVPGTLGLVAGPVSINSAASLTAPGGTIHVTSAAGTGEVPVDPRNTAALTVGNFGPVDIKGGSTLDVGNLGGPAIGGSVFVHAGALTISASEIGADNNGSGSGGVIALRGETQVALTGASVHALTGNSSGAGIFISTAPSGIVAADDSTVLTGSVGSGNAGFLAVSTGQLTMTNGAELASLVLGTGTAAPISVSANSVVVDGTASPAEILSIASGTAAAPAGDITIAAGEVRLVTGGAIRSGTRGSGNAGNITVQVAGNLSIDGTSATDISAALTDIASNTFGTGTAGNVTVTAGNLRVANNGRVASDTFASGDAGSVTVKVAGLLSIANGGAISASTFGTGAGGSVSVSAGLSSIFNGGQISSSTSGSGNAGNVSVTVPGQLIIDGSADPDIPTGVLAIAGSGSTGHAGQLTVIAGALSLVGYGDISSITRGAGDAGRVSVDVAGSQPGALTILTNGSVRASTFGAGDAGSVVVRVAGGLIIDGAGANADFITGISSQANRGSTGNAGSVTVTAGRLAIVNGGEISSDTFGPGNAGGVYANVTGELTIAGASESNFTGISSDTTLEGTGAGNAGNVMVSAGTLSISGNGGQISASTFGAGAGGNVSVTAGVLSLANLGAVASATFGSGSGGNIAVSVSGQLSIYGTPGDFLTGIAASSQEGSTGNAGNVTVHAGSASIVNNKAEIASSTLGRGNGGEVSVDVAGLLSIDGGPTTLLTGIAAQSFPGTTGNAGSVFVNARELAIINNGQISVSTQGPGAGGDVAVTVAGPITLHSGGQVTAATAGAGNGGAVRVTAQGPLSLRDSGSGIIALASSAASGDAGSVTVGAPQITLMAGAEISSTTAGTGAGGSVAVTTSGALVLDGTGARDTQIAASATGAKSGPGGSVTVGANALTIEGGAQIASSTAGPGRGGDVAVTVASGVTLSGVGPSGASGVTASAQPGSTGQAGEVELTAGGAIALTGGAEVATSTAGAGNGGTVKVTAQGPLSLTDPGSGIIASATSTASGNAGSVTVGAPQIALMTGAEIASTTAGTGAGGSVVVMTPGALVLDGAGVANTQIAASATGPQSGPGGPVTVGANALTIEGGAQIASSTAGLGKGGDVAVMVANGVTLSGVGPSGASGVTASAQPGSTGQAGEVVLTAGGAIALSGGAEVTTSTAGAGNGGTVQVTAQGPLSLTDPGTGIIASATSTASGNAGSVAVGAPQIALTTGAEIASTTGGTGAGGSVVVTTPGTLVLDSAGVANTQIAASATGPQSGPGGSVMVGANALTIEGGAQIASSTAGPGRGGDVTVTVASDIVLPNPGPQITARSTGSGDAGSITVSAIRLLMNDGAAISTEAETSTANGGNITLHVRDFLYLVSSEISTSVNGQTGNGGNIAIDPQLVILDHSSIIAQAIEGHGGNITITAGQFIPSSDSTVSASSELGISGTIVINGPRVDVNGALVVLSSQLRGRTEVLREACAARADRPISSLVEAGRGGLPQDPEATLPALYVAGRDLNPNPQPGTDTVERGTTALHTTARLTMRCS
jgi:filamentous hemagglutinin family protein